MDSGGPTVMAAGAKWLKMQSNWEREGPALLAIHAFDDGRAGARTGDLGGIFAALPPHRTRQVVPDGLSELPDCGTPLASCRDGPRHAVFVVAGPMVTVFNRLVSADDLGARAHIGNRGQAEQL